MKRSAGESPGVSLFPFLAILLCTMGALIVVLVVINRQVTRQATARDADAVAARRTLELDHEELQLQVKQLETARQSTLDQLAKARRRLSGLEDQSRQLNDQLAKMKESARLLAADRRLQERDALRAELAKLNARRRQLDEELAKAQKSASQKPSFAIIPYDGLYHTTRRPIYIECRGDAVILQPEAIEFTPNDFLGPSGPGNPLASALRAAREYWSSVPPPAPGVPTEPYPLLLVRPDGIIAYYLVRDAMSSWASEFGYELVEDDWKLEFPTPPDPQLVQMEKRAVAEARERMKWLAEVSPELFVRKSNAQYRVSSASGGLVRDGGPLLGHDPFADDPLGGFGRNSGSADPSTLARNRGGLGPANDRGTPYGPGSGTGAGNSNVSRNGGTSAISGTGGSFSSGGEPMGNLSGDALSGNASALGGSGVGSGQSFATTGSSGGPGESLGSASAGGPGEASGLTGGHHFASASRTNSFAGVGAGGAGSHYGAPYGQYSTSGEHTQPSGSGLLGQPGGGPAQAGSQTTASGNSTGQSGGAGQAGSAFGQAGSATGQPGSAMGQSGAADPSAMPGMPSPSVQFQAPERTASRSMADTRGRNWALPNREAASMPITRPIRIECHADRLVLIPDVRNQEAQVIPLSERTAETVDQLVAAVRAHTQGWGMAGRGMYWKPQLILEVDPLAEARAADLQVLLAESGLEVKRKR